MEAFELPSAVSVGGLTTMLISVAPAACIGLALAINMAAAKRPASAETRSSGNLLVVQQERNVFIELSNLPNRASTCRTLVMTHPVVNVPSTIAEMTCSLAVVLTEFSIQIYKYTINDFSRIEP
jgi:hypothetical protein